jgi:hypothetical protein
MERERERDRQTDSERGSGSGSDRQRDIQTVPVPVTNTEGDAERERGAEGGFDLDLLSILLSFLVSIVSSPSLVFISFLSSCTTRVVLVFSAGKLIVKSHRLGQYS